VVTFDRPSAAGRTMATAPGHPESAAKAKGQA